MPYFSSGRMTMQLIDRLRTSFVYPVVVYEPASIGAKRQRPADYAYDAGYAD